MRYVLGVVRQIAMFFVLTAAGYVDFVGFPFPFAARIARTFVVEGSERPD